VHSKRLYTSTFDVVILHVEQPKQTVMTGYVKAAGAVEWCLVTLLRGKAHDSTTLTFRISSTIT
jgi:hypothetical protein